MKNLNDWLKQARAYCDKSRMKTPGGLGDDLRMSMMRQDKTNAQRQLIEAAPKLLKIIEAARKFRAKIVAEVIESRDTGAVATLDAQACVDDFDKAVKEALK